MFSLHHTEHDGNVAFELLADGQRVPVLDWSRIAPGDHTLGLAVLSALVQADLATLSDAETALIVPSSRLAAIDDDRASALGLPPPPPFLLQIESRGALGSMRLETRWVTNEGLRVPDALVDGLFLKIRTATYRLASPLYELFAAVAGFNARTDATATEQASAWGEIQELIGIERERVEPGRFLSRIRVARATRFSLDFVPDDAGGFQIAPVPLAVDRRRRDAEDHTPLEFGLDADASSAVRLLSFADQRKFQRAFRSRANVQEGYLGGDDVFVVLAPEVQASLRVVREMQERPAAERVEFARNPYPFLKSASPDREPPFVETRSFSDRVLGLGALERIVLPWQILKSQGWLPPDMVEVVLTDQKIDVAPDQIEAAIVDVERAMAIGEQTVEVAGRRLPATAATRDALLDARRALDARAASEQKLNADGETEKRERVGLQVKRNLEAEEYAVRQAERKSVAHELPELVTALKPHQADAVQWLQRRWSQGFRGALLGDDMGLGKSLTALAFMMWLRGAMAAGNIEDRPILIVAPVSLLENWQAEHARHVGKANGHFVDVVKAYGATLPRRAPGRDIYAAAAMLDLDALTVDRFDRPTCVLTTYETLRDYQQSFASIHFALVAIDEAQRIKNPGSLTWQAVSALHADFWLALTGTPVENRLADLWAIADILEPGFLGTLKEFSARYETDFDEAALRALKARLEESPSGAPFMLRRMKDHVLDGLPEKHEYRTARVMPTVQSSAYGEAVKKAQALTDRGQMLAVIQQFREISLNPLRPHDVSPQQYVSSSARFEALFPILDDIKARDEKVLIFLDRNTVEAYLAQIVQSRYELPDLPPIINGEVPGKRRQQLVDAFQRRTGFDVMLLSPKAGGVGLTLTAANHVVHLSRWWNPAVEDQSTDRAYRIGQRKPVHVYYLQATLPGQPDASFDERLDALLKRKRDLSRELLWPFQGDESDARSLLGAERPA